MTIFVSIVGAGLPVAVSYGAMGLEFSVAQFAGAGWRYWREPRRFLPGPGEPSPGYVVIAEPTPTRRRTTTPRPGRERRRAAVGRLSAPSPRRGLPEAGELCAVEAIDREGLLVTSEGALVRYLRAAPKNPLVMSPVEREQVGHAFGQLAGRLPAGQSIQFYVEATPVRLDALLEHSQAEAERAVRGLAPTMRTGPSALRRLHAALRESLERHADEQAAVDVAYYVVVPYLPDQRARLDWSQLLPGAPAPARRRAA